MKLEDAIKTLEHTYGPLSFNKRTNESDFTTYTARVNAKFWSEVKTLCEKNQMKLMDFIRNAFVIYYFSLNGELSEEDSKKYLNPEIKDAGSKLDNVEKTLESINNAIGDKIDTIQDDVKVLSTQMNMLVTLFGGKLTATAAL